MISPQQITKPIGQRLTRWLSLPTEQVGKAPGTLTYIGRQQSQPVRLRGVRYADEDYHLFEGLGSETLTLATPSYREWIDVDGVHDPAQIARVGEVFGLHALVMEDVLDTTQKPKIEYFEERIFVVIKRMDFLAEAQQTQTEHIALLLSANQVISFQENQAIDAFRYVRERLTQGTGRLRRRGSDYLFYALIDNVVDQYYPVLDQVAARLEVLEEQIHVRPSPQTLRQLHALRRELILIRRAIWPVRELVATLQRDEHPLITADTAPFLRDLYDHVMHLIESVESYRDLVSSLQDLYLSTVSHRMNEIMKVLTIISTVFIPLTFIVGVYGMNFQHMPELDEPYGYYIVWGVMVLMAGVMLYLFRRRRWL